MAKQSRTSESEGKKSKSARRSSASRIASKADRSDKESNSLSGMFDALPDGTQESARRMVKEARRIFDRAKEYVSENPREAIGLAIAAGAVAWVTLATKPGRLIFEASAAALLTPQVSRWFAKKFSADAEFEH